MNDSSRINPLVTFLTISKSAISEGQLDNFRSRNFLTLITNDPTSHLKSLAVCFELIRSFVCCYDSIDSCMRYYYPVGNLE